MSATDVTLGRVFRLWSPLAGSWMLMAVEMPLVSAVVARLPDERVQLAAIGAVVYPVSILIEAPIIMLLAASTRLATDAASWRKLRHFAHVAGLACVALHALVAFTPLFDVVVRSVIGVPEDVVEPARVGLRIMTPWAWMIAWRRTQQGALIRVECSRQVAFGTAVRLATVVATLGVGYGLAQHGVAVGGAAVGAMAIVAGVVAEAAFAEVGARRLVAPRLAAFASAPEPWHWGAFLRFYLPLSCTPLISIALQPIGAAAMSRMPHALDSLAAWPAVYGLVFVVRSTGMAYQEVVVALAGRPGADHALHAFARRLAAVACGVLAVVAIPPVGAVWFGRVTGFPPELAAFCTTTLWFALPMPIYAVFQNLYQGLLVHARRSHAITVAVALYAAIAAALLTTLARRVDAPGIRVALAVFVVAGLAQTLWLRRAVPR